MEDLLLPSPDSPIFPPLIHPHLSSPTPKHTLSFPDMTLPGSAAPAEEASRDGVGRAPTPSFTPFGLSPTHEQFSREVLSAGASSLDTGQSGLREAETPSLRISKSPQ